MPRFTQDFNQKFPINQELARDISNVIPKTPSSRVEGRDGSPFMGNSIEMQNLSPRDASPLSKRPSYGSTTTSSDKPEPLEPFSVKEEFIAMLTFAIPLAIGVSARNMIYNIDTIYLGHIGVTQLAGASLAMNLTEMFGELYFSSCFTLTALTGQAVGCGNPSLAGNWMQLTMGIILAIVIPSCIFYVTCTHEVVLYLTGDVAVAHAAQEFNSIYWVGALFLALNFVLRQYAVGLKDNIGPMMGAIITVVLNLVLNQALVFGIPSIGFKGFGFHGSPLATSIALFMQMAIFVSYSFIWKKVHIKQRAWPGLSLKSFRPNRVKSFMELAVPSTIGAVLEKVGLTTLTFLAPQLGENATAAMQIMFNIQVLFSATFGGFSVATQVRVSNHVGRGDAESAKAVIMLSYCTVFSLGLASCTLLMIYGDEITSIYTNDETVKQMLLEAIPALCAAIMMIMLGTTAAFALNGVGRTPEVAGSQLISVWLVLIPVGIYMGFYNTGYYSGFQGLVWAAPVAHLVKTTLCTTLLFRTNWAAETAKARERNKKD